MADIKTNQSKVYNALKGMGFSGIGANEEDFANLMAKPQNREKVYKALTSKGYKGIGKDQAAFDSLIYQAPATQTQVAAQPQPTEQPAAQPQQASQQPEVPKQTYTPTWQEQWAADITLNKADDTVENATRPIDQLQSNAQTYQQKVNKQVPQVGVRNRVVEDNGSYITEDARRHNVLTYANQHQKALDVYRLADLDRQLREAFQLRDSLKKEMDKVPQDWVDQDGRLHKVSEADKQKYAELENQLSVNEQDIKRLASNEQLMNMREAQGQSSLDDIDRQLEQLGIRRKKAEEDKDFIDKFFDFWSNVTHPLSWMGLMPTEQEIKEGVGAYGKELKEIAHEENILGHRRDLVQEGMDLINELKTEQQGGLKNLGLITAARNVWDTATKRNTWDFGAHELDRNYTIMQAIVKMDNGQQLTPNEKALLNDWAYNSAASSQFNEQLSGWAKAGMVTGESLPFMLEMAINPASGLGEETTKALTKYAIKRYGSKWVRDHIKSVVAGKIATRAVADIAGAYGMATTTGAARTAADAMRRMTGQADIGFDQNGDVIFNGIMVDTKEEPLMAIFKSLNNTATENWSEMAGNYLGFLSDFMGKVVGKAVIGKTGREMLAATGSIEGVSLNKAQKFIYDLAAGKGIGAFSDGLAQFAKKTQWHGVVGEYLEEVMGNIVKATPLVGDMTFDTDENTGVFNLQQNIDTFCGVALMGGFMSALHTGGFIAHKRNYDVDRVNEANAKIFGDELWGDLKTMIDNAYTDPRELNNALTYILGSKQKDENGNDTNASAYSPEEKKAILKYTQAVLEKEGAEMAHYQPRMESSTREEVTGEDGKKQWQVTSVDKYGNTISQQAFDTEDEAVAYEGELKMQQQQQDYKDYLSMSTKLSFSEASNAIDEFLGLMGIDENSDDYDEALVYINDPNTKLGKEFQQFKFNKVIEKANASKAAIAEFEAQNGWTPGTVQWLSEQDPMQLDAEGLQMQDQARKFLEGLAYPATEVHVEHEQQVGVETAQAVVEEVVGDENMIDPQDNEGKLLFDQYTLAGEALGRAYARNEDLEQEVIRLEGMGLSPQEVISSLNSFRPEEVQAVIDFYNAKARYQGFMQEATKQIDKTASNNRQRHTLKGTIDGVADVSNVHTITDGTNTYTLVSGDITTDPATGRITGSASGLIIGLDENGDFVNISDTDGFSVLPVTQTLDQYEEAERNRLGQMVTQVVDPNQTMNPDLNQAGAEEQSGNLDNAGGEAGAENGTGANDPSATAPSSETQQPVEIPIDEKSGLKRYDRGVPVDQAIQDIQNDGFDVNEMADAYIAEAQEAIDKINSKPSKKPQDLIERKRLVDVMDYYNHIKVRFAELNPPAAPAESEENVNVQPEQPIVEEKPVSSQQETGMSEKPTSLTVDEQKQQRIAEAKAKYGELFDDDFTKANDVYELVSMWVGRKRNLAWDDVNGKRGLQKELGWTRKIGGDTKYIETLLAKNGEGMGVDDFVHMVWESPENDIMGEKRFSTEEIKEALLDLLKSAQSKSDVVDYALNTRIAAAETAMQEQQKKAEEEAAQPQEELPPMTAEQIAEMEANMPFAQPSDKGDIVSLLDAIAELQQQEGMPPIRLIDTDRMTDDEWYDLASALLGGVFVSQEDIDETRTRVLADGLYITDETGAITVYSDSQTAEELKYKCEYIKNQNNGRSNEEETGELAPQDVQRPETGTAGSQSQEAPAAEAGNGSESKGYAESVTDPYLQPRNEEEKQIIADVLKKLRGEIFAQQMAVGAAKQRYDRKRQEESERATDLFGNDNALNQPGQLFDNSDMPVDQSIEGVERRASAEREAWETEKAKLERLQSRAERDSRIRGALDNYRRQTKIDTEEQPTAYQPKWQYQFHYDKETGRVRITRDDVSGPIPIGDGRWHIDANSLSEMRGILENPANNLGEVFKEVEASLHNAEVDEKIRKEASNPVETIERTAQEFRKDQEEKKAYGADNKLVSQDRYEELKKRMKQKLLGQLNSGFDPEILQIGAEMAMFHIEAGARKFADYATRMINDLGDAVRPYLQSFYEAARRMPGMEELRKEMDSTDFVDNFDVLSYDKQGNNTVNEHKGENNETENNVNLQTEQNNNDNGQGKILQPGGTVGPTVQPVQEREPIADNVESNTTGGLSQNVPEGGNVGQRDKGVRTGERENIGSGGRSDRPVQRLNTNNNHEERGTESAPKSTISRIEANIEAITLMQKLVEEGREATDEEKKVLRQFSGWGGLGEAFNNPVYENTLRELLGDAAYEQAVMSRNSAYFTPAKIIDRLWDIASALGFKGGNVLEGSAGIGKIIGLMPTDLSENSHIEAVEIDETTGNILKLLYPDAQVEIQGFEDTKIPNGSVDLAITNVPFVTGLHVQDTTGDKDLSKKFKNIHDFCIAKNIRKLRDGGIGIFITSSGTLDNSNKLREWIIGEGGADVVGAFRLNKDTFGGTGATSDIIIVRKRVNGQKSANAIDVSLPSAVRQVEYDTGETKKVKGVEKPVIKNLALDYNGYFVEHPEDMGGEMAFNFERGETWQPTSKSCFPIPGRSQDQMLDDWVNRMTAKDWSKEQSAADEQPSQNYEKYGEGVKEGSLLLDSKGNICIAQYGQAVPLGVNDKKVKGRTKQECLRDYTAIKTALNAVLDYQTNNDGDEGLQPLLDKLNRAFNQFVAKYGHFHKNTSISFIRNDVDYASVGALETYKEKADKQGNITPVYGKADVFSRRVVEKEKEPKPKNVEDGVIASIYMYGGINIPYIAEQLGISEEKAKKEILDKELGYENPDTTQVEVSFVYLSGNVREKLEKARTVNTNGKYSKNISALEKVVPDDIPAHLIEFNLGSTWIDTKLYEEFFKLKTGKKGSFNPVNGTWIVNYDESWTPKDSEGGVISDVCDKTILTSQLIEAAMQGKSIRVSMVEKYPDGTSETIVDNEATQACATRIDELKQEFKDWARAKMQEEPEVAVKTEKEYNDKFNNYVPMEIPDEFSPERYSGQVLELNGKPFKLNPHQSKAVIKGITQPVLLAHEVGTGKTFTLITTAMEMRRIGTAKKPMIVVQNATVGQFAESAKALYPNAKILMMDDKDHSESARKSFYAKIKYNDWDLIIVPQSVLDKIPDNPDRQLVYINEKIREKERILLMLEEDPNNWAVVNKLRKEIDELYNDETNLTLASEDRMEKKKKRDEKKRAVSKQNAAVKAKEQLDRSVDDVDDFDDMEIDAILVDEAHGYKKLGFESVMQKVKGIDTGSSKKCASLLLKTRAVLEKSNGKNVVFATGTPVSNTAAEVWTFMRYLMPADVMEEYGILYFDDFARNFGSVQQMLEFTTAGKFKENNRFAGYVNMPELARIWRSVADIVKTEDAGAVKDKLPELEGGKATDIYLPQTKALRAVMKFVRQKLEEYEHMTGKEKKANSHIPLVMYGIAKAAAVDARLVDSSATDEPMSKTNEAVRQTLRTLEETKSYNGTVAIFADNYQNKHSGFNLYEDIKKKLIAQGVPADQIAIIRSGMTDKKKLDIFDKVNSGEIRVIMGSTQTLGTGVNIQERLHTLIHMDAPNRPMDYTQRNGRELRQGNIHRELGIPVRILRFGVEDSLDVTAYQRLKTKGAIADSVMNSKRLMENAMNERVLEEEEDAFGDTVAQLSGSEYAMLKNQAEKEVRKLEAKKKQHEADQIFIHAQLPRLLGQNNTSLQRIDKAEKSLAIVEKAMKQPLKIEVNGTSYDSMDAMADFFKEYNSKIKATEDEIRKSGVVQTQKREITVTINGIPFKFKTEISGERGYTNGRISFSTSRQTTFANDDLTNGERNAKGGYIKNGIEEILNDYLSGKDYREIISTEKNAIARNEGQLKMLEERNGKEFTEEEALQKAYDRLEEYTQKMKEEMEAKEAKYKEMDSEVEASDSVTVSDEDEESESGNYSSFSSDPIEAIKKAAESWRRERGNINSSESSTNKPNDSTTSDENGLYLPTDWDILPENDVDNNYTGDHIKGLHSLLREIENELNKTTDARRRSILSQEANAIRDELARRKQKQDEWRKRYNIKADGSIALDDIARLFKDLNKSEIIGKLFDKVYEVAKKIGPKINFVFDLDGSGHSAYTGKIRYHFGFATATNRQEQSIAATILHELIHSVTQSTISAYKKGGSYADSLTRSQKQAAKEIISIWEKIEDIDEIKNSSDKGVQYGATSPHEMVSQMADPYFREALKSIMIDGRSVFEKLIDAIKRIIGMEVHPRQTTAFDALDKALDNLINNFRRDTFEATRGYDNSNEEWIRKGHYSPLTEKSVIERLEKEPKVKVYRAMQLIDGKLYPPMAAKQGGKLVNPIELGKWEKADEHPEMADENGKFKLDKGNGKSLKAAYNPYIHTSTTMLNDQFSEAQNRDNLVVVEVEVPESELTSGYKAEKAKDSVGKMDWKAGIIQGQLSGTREVILSRWDKPVRIVPTEEVAQHIYDMINGKVEVMPTNVVTPQQREALEKLGVKFVETDNRGFIKEGENAGKSYSSVYGRRGKTKPANGNYSFFGRRRSEDTADPIEAIEESARRWRRDRADAETKEIKEDSERALYDERLNSIAFVTNEAFHDSMAALKVGQEEIAHHKDIPDSQNAYMAENLMHGKNKVESDAFNKFFRDPLLDAVSQVLAKMGWNMKEMNRYLFTKHGFERNRELYVRDFVKKRKEARQKAYNRATRSIRANYYLAHKITEDEMNEQLARLKSNFDKYNERLNKKLVGWEAVKTGYNSVSFPEYINTLTSYIINNFNKKYDPAKHDYSGFTEMYGDEDGKYSENDILDSIADQEDKMGAELHDELWNRVNSVNEYGLNKYLESGMRSEEEIEKIGRMFHWYVPMRGFAEDTAEDMYQYFTSGEKANAYVGGLIKQAKGRKSEAKSPLSTMLAMNYKAIKDCNQNLVNQKFYRLIQANPNDITIVSDSWAMLNEMTGMWEEVAPEIPDDASEETVRQITLAWEESMRQLALEGKAKKIHGKAEFVYKPLDKKKKDEHRVEVRINGNKRIVTVVGNPRMAQALNGHLRYSEGDGIVSKSNIGRRLQDLNRTLLRYRQAFSTNYSLSFVWRNAKRDWTHFSMLLTAKEGLGYTKAAEGYYFKSLKGMRKLFKKYREGTLDMSKEIERDFKDFMDNGGITGFVQMQKVDEIERDFEKLAKKIDKEGKVKVGKNFWEKLKTVIEAYNEAIENRARFATYRASRHYAGRTKARSAYDAKEITANFNRRGAGRKTVGIKGVDEKVLTAAFLAGNASQILNANKMFFNATVQAIATLGSGLKNADGKTRASWFGKQLVKRMLKYGSLPLVLSGLVPLLNNALVSAFGGGDDDEPYANLPEWVRRNNICLYIGNGNFLTLALGQELAAFYALGDMIAGLTYYPELKPVDKTLKDELMGFLSVFSPVDMETKVTKDNKGFFESMAPEYIGRVYSNAAPLINVSENLSWMGRPIYREDRFPDDEYEPEYKMAFNSTGKAYKRLSQALNWIGGGDDVHRGAEWLQLNPGVMQYLVEQYLGGIGRTAVNTGDAAGDLIRYATGRDQDFNIRKIEGVRALFQQSDDQTQYYRSKAKYRKYKNEADALEHDIKGYQEGAATNPEYILKLVNLTKGKEAARLGIINYYETEYLKPLRKAINASEGNDKRELQKTYNQVIKEAVDNLDNAKDIQDN